MQLDSRGNHFVPIEQSQINTPAMAAAIVIQDFTATRQNELSIKVSASLLGFLFQKKRVPIAIVLHTIFFFTFVKQNIFIFFFCPLLNSLFWFYKKGNNKMPPMR